MSAVPARTWTVLGGIDGGALARLDDRGGLGPGAGGWRLEWWVRSEQPWHRPAMEAAVRQSVAAGESAVETRMRVPGGDIVAIAWVGVDRDGGAAAVMRVENDTPVPVALAAVVCPVDAEKGGIAAVTITEDGMIVNAEPVVRFDRAPAAAFAGRELADIEQVLLEEEDGHPRVAASSAERAAVGAAVFPVPHRTAISFSVGLGESPPGQVAALPDVATVGRGWLRHLDRGATLVLGSAELDSAVDGARRQLLIAAGGADGVDRPVGRWAATGRGQAIVGLALLESGFVDEARVVAAGLHGQLERNAGPGWAAGFLVLADALSSLLDGHPASPEIIAVAVGRLHDAIRRPRRRPAADQGLVRGEVPWWGSGDYAIEHSVWGLAGLRGAARMLDELGQTDGAEDVGSRARALAERLAAVPTDERVGCEVGALLGLGPLGVATSSDPATALAAAVVWRHDAAMVDGLMAQTMRQRSPIGIWLSDDDEPEAARAALGLMALHRTAVHEVDGEVIAASTLSPAALGRNWELYDHPLPSGPVSVAMRWHGSRPALLWDRSSGRHRTLRAPGLDPEWSSEEPKGEVLFDAPPTSVHAGSFG